MAWFLKLFLMIALQLLFTVLLYRRSSAGRSAASKPWLNGILFGLLAILANLFTLETGGVQVSVSDAAPLIAGLVFGPLAGLSAGVIGAVGSWLLHLAGGSTYIGLANTASVLLAGLLSAGLSRWLFPHKIPSWGYGLAAGIVTEILHMLLIFIAHLSNVEDAFVFVHIASVPDILMNSLSVMLAIMAVAYMYRRKVKSQNDLKQISQTFTHWLLLCVVIAFICTSAMTWALQTNLSETNAVKLLQTNISDVQQSINDANDHNLLTITNQIAATMTQDVPVSNGILILLANRYNVAEINVVNSQGIITASTQASFVNYDMSSGEQSAAFLCLLNGETEYVQQYQPISYNQSIYRKYAGVSFRDGFLQVGYDATQFQDDIDSEVTRAARNRHVGYGGYLIISDALGHIVSDPNGGEGQDITTAGLSADFTDRAENKTFVANVYQQSCYCMYVSSEGYHIIAVLPQSEAIMSRDLSVYVMVFMEVLVFAALFAEVYVLIRVLVVDNIRRVNDSLQKITGGNLNVKVDVRSNEEFATLSDDINSTVVTLKRYIADAAARIDKELSFAKSIQHSALPSVFPPYPDRLDFDIYAEMYTAKEVGGDFYDFYLLGEDRLAFLIADVSDKGIPAAMFMMTAKTLLKSLTETGIAINEVFTKANMKLTEHNEAQMFVTVWMGILNLRTGMLEYVNAGHNPPLLYGDDGYEYLRSKPGFVLAGLETTVYRKNTVQMKPGQRLFLYTDGLTEAMNAKKELFGEERLKTVLNEHPDASVKDLCHLIRKDVRTFMGNEPRADDITMMSLLYRGAVAPAKEITLPAETANIEQIVDFVNEALQAKDCDQKTQTAIDIAVDEVVANIADYAYAPATGDVTVRVSFQSSPRAVILTFIDSGVPFNPLLKKDPDTTLSAEERTAGGLGIFLVRKSMDDVQYRHEGGQNVFSMVKKY